MRGPWMALSGVAALSVAAAVSAHGAASTAALPVRFEAGQAPGEFLGRGLGYGVYLDPSGAVIALAGESGEDDDLLVGLSLRGANPKAPAAGERVLGGVTNVYRGNDPADWRTGLTNYGAVRYISVYPGVDLVYEGNGRMLELVFYLAPTADPCAIEMRYEGVERLEPDAAGNLVLASPGGELLQRAPVAYQGPDPVEVRYELRDGAVGFALGEYDPDRPLVIDPVVDYSTHLGGSDGDAAYGLAVDPQGNMYLAGYSGSSDFPEAQGSLNGFWDMVVAKLDAEGSALVYSTYLSASGDFGVKEFATGIDADAEGNAYMTGRTNALDFPTVNAFQPDNAGHNDAVIVKLDATGQILFSTYFGGGGNENGQVEASSRLGEIAVDEEGFIYVAGATASIDFPVVNAIDDTNGGEFCPYGQLVCPDVFLSKFSNDGQELLFSTYLGGPFTDEPYGMALDPQGNIYMTGRASDFPATPGAFSAPGDSIFVLKVRADLTDVDYVLTYGTGLAHAIAVDGEGRAYVSGTTSSFEFPTTPGAFQEEHGGCFNNHCWQAFVSVFSPDGTELLAGTYIGSAASNEDGTAIGVDSHGNAIVAVQLENSPTRLRKFDATLSSQLVNMPVLGAGEVNSMRLDPANNVYIAGFAWGGALNNVTPDAFQPEHGGQFDMFVTMIDMEDPPDVPGDVNSDGSIDTSDLLALLAAWGPCAAPPDPCAADVDGDGTVGTADLLALLSWWHG